MIYTVVGLQVSKGTFNGLNYDNTKLHCIFEPESEHFNGTGVEIITVSNDYLLKNKMPILINKKIKVYYNKYGKVEDILIVE